MPHAVGAWRSAAPNCAAQAAVRYFASDPKTGTISRSGKKRKLVTEITEVVGYEPGEGVRMVRLFERGTDGLLRPTGHLPTFLPELIENGLVRDAVDFVRAVGKGA